MLNDLKFESRAKEIKKHQNSADQIVLEQEMIEELQESINAMTNNLDGEIGKQTKPKNELIYVMYSLK